MSLINELTAMVAKEAARNSGMSEGMTQKMMPMAMAAIMGGLKKNASNPQGAEALAGALDRHDGGILNNLAGLGDSNVQSDGQKILGHIFGGKQATTEKALARTAGVDQSQISNLMAMAAPVILASLGQAKRQGGLDVSSLAGLVSKESATVQQAAPKELGGLMQFLDSDGDGDFKDDLLEAAGKQLLGGLFGRK
jgi:hypothetical protein